MHVFLHFWLSNNETACLPLFTHYFKECVMKFNFTTFMISILFFSCTAPESMQSITRLAPINGSGKWVDGQELHSFENDSLRVVVVADYQNLQKLAFVVSILNKSNTEKIYSSNDFQLYPVNFRKRNKYNYTYAKIEDTLNADDPEMQIIQEQYKMTRAISSIQNNATWSLLHATLHLATDIMDLVSPSKSTQKNEPNHAENMNRYDNTIFENAILSNTINYMSSEDAIAVLKEKAFRKNSVAPGAAYGGTIYFPKMNYARKLALRMKFGNQVLLFQFQQKIFINGESIDN